MDPVLAILYKVKSWKCKCLLSEYIKILTSSINVENVLCAQNNVFISYSRNLQDFGCVIGIMKTCLHNVDPLKPHFYVVNLGFTGVYIIFLFLLKNIDCGYPLEPPRQGTSNEYPQSMF